VTYPHILQKPRRQRPRNHAVVELRVLLHAIDDLEFLKASLLGMMLWVETRERKESVRDFQRALDGDSKFDAIC